ncbi:ecotropic viral integration site 2B, partial [Chelydra serpentina]
MDTNHIILIFFYGQLWRSLSIEIQRPPTNLPSTIFQTQTRNTSIRLEKNKGNTAPRFLYQSKELAILPKTEKPSAAIMTPQTTATEESESSDGSWIAALLIGIILSGMIIVIIIILLWKCFKKPAQVDPNWAGRSPFADGDTPDIFVESIKEMEPSIKRTSVLSILPWKINKNTPLDDSKSSESKERVEKPPSCNTKEKSNQSTPTLKGGSGPLATNISVSSSNIINVPLPPVSDGLSDVCDPPLKPILPPPESLDLPPPTESLDLPPPTESLDLPPPTESLDLPPPTESLDLPPPPDWLNEVPENHCPEISKSLEFQSEAQSEIPPPPDLPHQDV